MRRLLLLVAGLACLPGVALAWPSWMPFGLGSVTEVPGARPPVPDFSDRNKAGDCALTFDDGPGPHTGLLLDVLKARGVRATFFVLGQHVRHYPDVVRRIAADGHEVENHSWDHPNMRKLDEAARRKEIEDTVAELRGLGITPRFFRPPYGAYDPALVELARRNGLEVVLWSRDSEDWRYHTVAAIEGNVIPRGQGAHGIFLFHDIHDSTVAAMGGVVDDLGRRGCRFVTIAEYRADGEGYRKFAQPSGTAAPAPAVQ